jgi:hypothetical protein
MPDFLQPNEQSIASEADDDQVITGESYCVCGRGDGDMIGCDGSKCPGNGWYHPECLGIVRTTAPRGEWLCPPCFSSAAAKRRRTGQREQLVGEQKQSEQDYIIEKIGKGAKAIPLKVESAERQSREEMENLLAATRRIEFDSQYRAVRPGPTSGRKNSQSSAAFPEGLCMLHIGPTHFKEIKRLHKRITTLLGFGHKTRELLTPWAGVAESDRRRRGYAFLPASYGKFGKDALVKKGVSFHAAEKSGHGAKKDEAANWKSCVRLKESDVTGKQLEALEALVQAVAEAVPRKYRKCISLNNLQALQPNLHNGTDHLPPHTDSPLNDGFGVVIATVCVHHSAQILLLPNDSPSASPAPRSAAGYVFEAGEGDMYVLSGRARNDFDHGVLCPPDKGERRRRSSARSTGDDSESVEAITGSKRKLGGSGGIKDKGRESLNLRFGIHGVKPEEPYFVGDEMPLFTL